jgi:C_GCAxxG_C_C family probable redox protein
MNRPDNAVAMFEQGFSCSQAILATYGEKLGLDRETALRVAGAFGAGMGRMGETCGAVTGALMVIGLKHGKTRAEDEASKEKAYALVKEFVEKFTARNESIVCRELLGCSLGTPGGLAVARERGLFKTVCPKLVRDAAEILEEIVE